LNAVAVSLLVQKMRFAEQPGQSAKDKAKQALHPGWRWISKGGCELLLYVRAEPLIGDSHDLALPLA
jgi:hypothetical protein